MVGDNDYYGHADLLRAYAGVQRPLPLPGRLQHGWAPGPGLHSSNLSEPWTKFLWAQRNLDQARDVAGVEAIGAPFLYLPPVKGPPPPAGSLLVFPFHGWERESVAGDFGRYADAIAELEAQGYTDVTVCLYWLEYDDPALRAIFEARGWRVVTNGHRDGNPEFLRRQRDLLLRHSAVTSNRVCTAAFYALASRRAFFLHGPTMGLSGTSDPDGAEFDAWQRAEFPELVALPSASERVLAEDDPRTRLGLRELGAAFVRTPDGLRERMRWRRRDWPRRFWLRAWPVAWRKVSGR